MEKINFTKMSGAGNDFIVIDENKNPEISLTPPLISKLCNRRNGIGADGVITISNYTNSDFKMNYYNSDGSSNTLCGNGARCAIKFAGISSRLKNSKANFIANEKEYSGEILSDDNVKFNLNEPEDLRDNLNLKINDYDIKAFFINTGSPHVVVKIDEILKHSVSEKIFNDLNEVPVKKVGKEIRNLKDFAPGGANVNFIAVSNNKINIRTYERGVEDETLACGTGAVAAALISSLYFDLQPPVKLITHGGDELIVNFDIKEKNISALSLTGPAKEIYSGYFLLNKFS